MDSAFYVREEGRFVSSPLTRGPWDPGSQHAGPPIALLGRELERCPSPLEPEGAPPRWQPARVTVEILRPVPIAPLTARAEVVRRGRTVELLAGSLADQHGEVIRAHAWRIATTELSLPAGLVAPAAAPIALPDQVSEEEFPGDWDEGYHSAMDYRFVAGRFLDPGPATVWMRPRAELVAGEPPSPLQRVLLAADSGNGVSATLDRARYLFVNVELSVHLHRLPATDWVCLDAATKVEPSGIGLADSTLHDERGPIGRAMQALVVRERA